jgi:signal transduction histidine kinase
MSTPDRKKSGDTGSGPVQSQAKKKPSLIEEAIIADLPKPMGPPDSGPKLASFSRLDHLYRIGKLFAEFESSKESLEAVLAIISNTLPIRTAILINEAEGRAQVRIWTAEGVSARDLRRARTHAEELHAYFVASTLQKNPNVAVEESMPASEPKSDKNFIVTPLVVDHRPAFGTLQLECTTRFNEADLAFVNAMANQLALALDRYNTRQREAKARNEAEAAERRMRFLVDASRVLAASLDYWNTWEGMARLAVRDIADFCLIDVLAEDQSRRRITILSPNLPEITEKDVEGALAEVASHVLRTSRPVIYPKTDEDFETRIQEITEDRRSFESYVCVPLLLNERALGTLTLVKVRSDDLYTSTDLILLEDLARRTVAAFENAHLYSHALQAIRSRDDVLNVVSHDLKEPLTIITGFSGMFLRQAEPKENLICDRKQVEAIQRSAKQMNRLIGDLLDTASIEARHLSVESQACPVYPLVSEAMELAQSLAGGKALQLKSEIPRDIPLLFVDRRRILQVFANLISNAIKFTPAGGTITVRAAHFEDKVQCSVEDTGSGIPEDELPHIFDRFWQAPATAHLGTGLGLYIVKGIVEGHGGRIWVESTVGQGSRFIFTLPVIPPERKR